LQSDQMSGLQVEQATLVFTF